jgi:predicted NBD/HSP70 family sugar kinase
MANSSQSFIVGLDNGGTMNNATVLDPSGHFLVEHMLERPSRVREGPDRAIESLAASFDQVLDVTGVDRAAVSAVGLDTPGPASADGVLSSKGATNFGHPGWRGFNIRAALEEALGLPVVYTNDANAATLYAHYARFGEDAPHHSSVAVIVGTGLGGGLVESGHVVSGIAGMAGELGHVQIPLEGLLEEGQPVPACNCGLLGDVESFASLSGIEQNLLPYWLSRYEGHGLADVQPLSRAAKLVRGYGEAGDPMARKIFGQQAAALGRLFSIAAMFTDPGTYFVGGGVVEADPAFSEWFLGQIREHTTLRAEQAKLVDFVLVPDLDRAGARGAALAARSAMGDRA